MQDYRIAVIPGDGIGQEVIPEGLKVLEAVASAHGFRCACEEFPWGSEEVREHIVYRADDVHPDLSSVLGEASMTVRLKDRVLEWRTVLDVRSDEKNFHLDVQRELSENSKLIRHRRWQSTVVRDGQAIGAVTRSCSSTCTTRSRASPSRSAGCVASSGSR